MKIFPNKFKCCLRGAYGPGNFGDDLLMLASYNILKDYFNSEDLVITAKNTKSLNAMIPNVSVVSPSSFVFSDVTFLGGGGQYFSFQSKNKNSPYDRFYSQIKKVWAIKKESSFYDIFRTRLFRKFYGKRWLSKSNIGFCLGLGPFENENSKEAIYAKKELFGVKDYLSVRDQTSKHLAEQFGCGFVEKYSDPIFNQTLWLQDNDFPKKFCKNSVSIIIRSWPFKKDLEMKIAELSKLSSFFESINIKAKFISLYESYDKKIISTFEDKGISVVCWNPNKLSLNDFLAELCSSAYIITTRAHGAIVPATLGIPPMIINVEPKLSKVHSMLSNSSLFVEIEDLVSKDKMLNTWMNYVSKYGSLKEKLESDLEKNISSAIEAENRVRGLLNGYSNNRKD